MPNGRLERTRRNYDTGWRRPSDTAAEQLKRQATVTATLSTSTVNGVADIMRELLTPDTRIIDADGRVVAETSSAARVKALVLLSPPNTYRLIEAGQERCIGFDLNDETFTANVIEGDHFDTDRDPGDENQPARRLRRRSS